MQSSLSLSLSSSSSIVTRSDRKVLGGNTLFAGKGSINPQSLRFCGLRSQIYGLQYSNSARLVAALLNRRHLKKVSAALSDNGTPSKFDYDLVIIGAGVGGHGAALHAVEKVKLGFYVVLAFELVLGVRNSIEFGLLALN